MTVAGLIVCFQLFATLVAFHFLLDFAGQGDFMAKAKNPAVPIPGVPWAWAMAGHAWIHGVAVGIITGHLWLGVAEAVLHFATDLLKCRGKISFGEDQFIHVLCKLAWTGWVAFEALSA